MKSAGTTDRPLTRANHRAAIRAHRRRAAISAAASAVVCGQRSPNCTLTTPNCRPKTSNRFHHRNQQYSVIALTDGTGAIEERYAYSAYGKPVFTNASGTALADSAKDNRYTYTGREWDEELSLYHFRARMYDAESGRFVSRDSIKYFDSNLLFEFLKSRPLSRLDSLGHLSRTIVGSSEPEGNCGTWNFQWRLRRTDPENEATVVQRICFLIVNIKCNKDKDDCCELSDEFGCYVCYFELIKDSRDEQPNFYDTWGTGLPQGDCGNVGLVQVSSTIRTYPFEVSAEIESDSGWDKSTHKVSCDGLQGGTIPISASTTMEGAPFPSWWSKHTGEYASKVDYQWDCCEASEESFDVLSISGAED